MGRVLGHEATATEEQADKWMVMDDPTQSNQ